ncbi:3-deoxy-7-phosphoheptulonate synthase [Streptomyces mutabilis]|uniref:3-deoxy-7-phosphoheptulonate synthase n=1 Tax=Streptomyces mutabilis TaxID=67332 RepID=UPI001784EA04|nr:3-deoxy-7-phosphoheptulonate synthase [Streptomyces mutabilis]GGQ47570.1 phospho-2-dehydro-3-deoxyheptonate aldolase [Streptomyces mutabilis]
MTPQPAERPAPVPLDPTLEQLHQAPPLVFAPECDRLRHRLAAVARGEALLLQGGGATQALGSVRAEAVRGMLGTLLQMAVLLAYAAALPVVKVGRAAGPPLLPDTAAPPPPDADHLLRTYRTSSAVLNLVRAFTDGRYADMFQAHAWNMRHLEQTPDAHRHRPLAEEMDRAVSFLRSMGMRSHDDMETYVSHDAVLLDYEAALTRDSARGGGSCASSGHLLWTDADRPPDGPHADYLAGVSNAVVVRIGRDTAVDTVLGHLDRLDPEREPGRLTFAVGVGADQVRDVLPPLVEKTLAEGARVCWISDPQPALVPIGDRSALVAAVLGEVRGFVEVHRALGTHPGGVRVDVAGEESGGGALLTGPEAIDLAFGLADVYREAGR